MSLFLIIAGVAQAAATPPAAQSPTQGNVAGGHEQAAGPAPSPDDTLIETASTLLTAGKPAEAMALAEQIIASSERTYPQRNDTVYFSAQSMPETLIYATMASAVKKNGVVTNGTWGTAYFLKGFALIDLNRGDEALPWLEKAVALAPMNAQYLAERAEWYKSRRKWNKALADFENARSGARLAPDDAKVAWEGRAIRGLAFVKIEQGKYDEAEKLLNEALRLNPADQRARADLAELPSLRR